MVTIKLRRKYRQGFLGYKNGQYSPRTGCREGRPAHMVGRRTRSSAWHLLHTAEKAEAARNLHYTECKAKGWIEQLPLALRKQ